MLLPYLRILSPISLSFAAYSLYIPSKCTVVNRMIMIWLRPHKSVIGSGVIQRIKQKQSLPQAPIGMYLQKTNPKCLASATAWELRPEPRGPRSSTRYTPGAPTAQIPCFGPWCPALNARIALKHFVCIVSKVSSGLRCTSYKKYYCIIIILIFWYIKILLFIILGSLSSEG